MDLLRCFPFLTNGHGGVLSFVEWFGRGRVWLNSDLAALPVAAGTVGSAGLVKRMYGLYRNESQPAEVLSLETVTEDCACVLKSKLAQRKVILQTRIAPTIPPLRLVQRDLLQV